jgi:hypothetical protein
MILALDPDVQLSCLEVNTQFTGLIEVVGSTEIYDCGASRNSGFLFLLLPPLPDFLLVPSSVVMAFLMS